MRLLLTTAALCVAAFAAAQEKKGKSVEVAGMKSVTPADWAEKPLPPNSMRFAQFTLPKAEGDKEDGELALFVFPGGSGTVEANLERQRAKFLKDGLKEKKDKVKVGDIEATYQDLAGTFLKKPFPMAKEGTPMEDFRQLYVVFEAKDGKQYYMTLLGPQKTVEKHKKPFEEWLKNFK